MGQFSDCSAFGWNDRGLRSHDGGAGRLDRQLRIELPCVSNQFISVLSGEVGKGHGFVGHFAILLSQLSEVLGCELIEKIEGVVLIGSRERSPEVRVRWIRCRIIYD